MISRTILGRNMISVRDTQMRRILQNMMNYIYSVEWLYEWVKQSIENPEAVEKTVNDMQWQFAQKMIEMNNIMNDKFVKMDGIVQSRLNEMEATIWTIKKVDNNELQEQVEALTKLVLKLEWCCNSGVAMTKSSEQKPSDKKDENGLWDIDNLPTKKEKITKTKKTTKKKKNKRE